MGEIKYFDSEKMLRKADIGLSADEAALERFSQPIQDVSWPEQGELQVKGPDYGLEMSYSLIAEEVKEEINRVIESWQKEYDDNEGANFIDLANWKKLETIQFKQGDNIVDLSSLVPNLEFYISPERNVYRGKTTQLEPEQPYKIYFAGNLATPKGLGVLLHEIGHAYDDERISQLGINRLVTSHEHAELAELLRKERAATAFALKFFKKYIPNKDFLKDADQELGQFALQSYYKIVKFEMKLDELEKSVQHELEEESRLREGFLKWQLTDAYTNWKKQEAAIKDEEDVEMEFEYWLYWIKETNYDYTKDLK